MRIIICLAIIMALASFNSRADNFDYDSWSTHYYEHKDPSKIKGFIAWLDEKDMSTMVLAYGGMLAVIFTDNPDKMDEWRKGSHKESTQMMLDTANALATGGAPAHKKITEVTINDPEGLDICWGAFLASGNKLYIDKMVATLDDNAVITTPKDEDWDRSIRGEVERILTNNVAKHQLLEKYLKQDISGAKPQVKAKLEKILSGH